MRFAVRIIKRGFWMVVDLLDGVLAAALYGQQGGFGGVYGPDIERQNNAKLRRWARTGGTTTESREGATRGTPTSGSQHFKL
jgi:hypothetical protein